MPTTKKQTTHKKTTKKSNNTKKITAKKQKSAVNFQEHFLPDTNQTISFQGVRTHNLKDIDINLPKNQVITITGVSGSGKSSLAFHTIYKEGQYRYIESLSSYLRQFFNLGDRPDLDHCAGLSPAIAIEQNKRVGNVRSTVGTLTEIDDYLRLLFAKLGDLYCYASGKPIIAQTVDQIMQDIKKSYAGDKVYLLKQLQDVGSEEELQSFVLKNRKRVDKGKGFTRFLLVYDDPKTNEEQSIEYFYLETPNLPKDKFPIKIYGIFDRVTIEEKKMNRLKEDIIKILAEVKKFGVYRTEGDQTISWYTDKIYSPDYDIEYPEFTSQHFSANRQEGACPHCHGIGEVLQVDMDKILDPQSPYMKTILPRRDSALGQGILKKLAQKYSINMETVRKDLPEWFQHVVIEGDDELLRIPTGGKYVSKYYKGIEDIIKDQYARGILTVDFQAMLDMNTCPVCHGMKLRKESLHVFLTIDKKNLKKFPTVKNGDIAEQHELFANKAKNHDERPYATPITDGKVKYNIADLQHMPLDNLVQFLQAYHEAAGKYETLVGRIINPLLDRAQMIEQLGLGYLTLHRGIDTLSGGEIQRLRLAKQLGNKLTGIIYVLDEPTIGLSDWEIQKTIKAIRKLQEIGNTVIVVEHNEEFIEASDRVVEIGPAAGDFGGKVIFNGPYDAFIKGNTLTAQYVKGTKKVIVNFDHTPTNQKISIRKASKYNLDNVNIDIRLGSFTIITGPSGAGKTTLMYTTLFRFLQDKQKFIQSYIRLQLLKKGRSWQEIISAPVMQKEDYLHYENMALQEFYKDLAVDTITGHEEIKNLLYVDQSSIGKTPRSCPATFIGTFDKIRQLFAGTTEAKYLGFTPGHFSFNSSKGSCPECNGYGYKKVELQFLPDTYVPCELCKGNRYKPEILGIKRHSKTIADVLNMYVDEALELFKEMPHIHEELQLMCDIGLGYLKMGQPAHTLSGGESQRLKLVKHLLKSYKGHTMYFLDEPTVGLHPQDIEKLLLVLQKFLQNGDTILMIEHDRNLLQFADDIIALDDGKLVKK